MPSNRLTSARKSSAKPTATSSFGLAELAYNGLLEGIRQGRFLPGEPIREHRVTAWLNISRTPVRDAMRRLEAEGFLIHERNRGVVVATLEDEAVIELYTLREVLECAAVRMAVRNANEGEIVQLEQLVSESSKHQDPRVLIKFQRRINDLIHQMARNRFLVKTMRRLRETMFLVGTVATVMPDRPATLLREHRQILDAIKRRDSKKAEKVMREHVHSALESHLKLRASSEGADYPYVPFPAAAARVRTPKPRK